MDYFWLLRQLLSKLYLCNRGSRGETEVSVLKIGNRPVGPDFPPLVIAEIGINHNGCIKVAKNMVLQAAQSGCEVIKHQTHFVSDEMTDEARSIFPPNSDISIWEIMEQSSLSPEDEMEMKRFTEQLGLIWLSTPFSRKAADFLEELNVPAFKIGSGEVDNLPLIRHIAKKGKPVIMSTGMQTLKSIARSVNILEENNISYALLECTNLYPSPPNIVSLKGVVELKKKFPNSVVGFSDHSMGPTMALAAVALGANILERHFTDTRYRTGPDISCSMDPAELRFLIDRSKEVWQATRNEKERSKPEEEVYKFARASVVADRNINCGEIITEENVWTKRPGTGEIAAYDLEKVIGLRASRDIKKNTQLSWKDIKN